MSFKIYNVSEINKLIKEILESNFYGIWIEGEISSLRYSSTGHLYFSLIDDTSSIGAIIYKNRLKNLKMDMENGMKVTVFGSLSLYLRGGEYRIVVEHIRTSGVGKKFYDLEKLKREFKAKGYFDRKRAIPNYPNNIIIITSPTGAAVHDITNILSRRALGINIYIYPVSVQGNDSKVSILRAFSDINSIMDNIDLAIIARGGGSNEDLWIFNDPDIAKGLFNLKFPTISAIGHEIDFTLTDFVADLRAETPSAAAELITKSKLELMDNVKKFSTILNSELQRVLSTKKTILQQYSNRRNYIRIKGLVNNKVIYVDILNEKINSKILHLINTLNKLLQRNVYTISKNNPINNLKTINERTNFMKYKIAEALNNTIKNKNREIEFYKYKLQSLNPKAILKRGYTITTNEKGVPLKSVKKAINENTIETQFYDGKIKSTVLKNKE